MYPMSRIHAWGLSAQTLQLLAPDSSKRTEWFTWMIDGERVDPLDRGGWLDPEDNSSLERVTIFETLNPSRFDHWAHLCVEFGIVPVLVLGEGEALPKVEFAEEGDPAFRVLTLRVSPRIPESLDAVRDGLANPDPALEEEGVGIALKAYPSLRIAVSAGLEQWAAKLCKQLVSKELYQTNAKVGLGGAGTDGVEQGVTDEVTSVAGQAHEHTARPIATIAAIAAALNAMAGFVGAIARRFDEGTIPQGARASASRDVVPFQLGRDRIDVHWHERDHVVDVQPERADGSPLLLAAEDPVTGEGLDFVDEQGNTTPILLIKTSRRRAKLLVAIGHKPRFVLYSVES